MALTVMWLNAQLNKPQEKIVRKSDGNGLGVRISLQGKITFTFRYRYQNKQSSVDLGSYPLVSLQQARSICQSYRAELEQGVDPTEYKFERGERFQTFQDYAEAWYTDYFNKQARSKMFMNQIRRHLYPTMGNIVVSKSTTHQWLTLMKDLHAVTKLGDCAFSLLTSRISQILKYATKHYKLPFNPASGITASDFNLKIKPRNRLLSENELLNIYRIFNFAKIHTPYIQFAKLLLHTGARAAEVSQARVNEFNFEANVWTIPAEHSKAGHTFYRPLLPQTVVILKILIENKNPEDPIFGNYEGKAVSLTFHSRASDTIREWGELHLKQFNRDWVLHDFRRTFRTNINRWIVRNEVSELALGHVQSGIHATYNLYSYIDEMREGYAGWLNYLDSLDEKVKKEGLLQPH